MCFPILKYQSESGPICSHILSNAFILSWTRVFAALIVLLSLTLEAEDMKSATPNLARSTHSASYLAKASLVQVPLKEVAETTRLQIPLLDTNSKHQYNEK
jgi:hypothetical protein